MVISYGLFIKLINLGVPTQVLLIDSLGKEEGYPLLSIDRIFFENFSGCFLCKVFNNRSVITLHHNYRRSVL